MAAIRASVGRVRVTSATLPGEPGYIRSMRLQMDQIAKVLKEAIDGVERVTAQGIAFALEPILARSQELVPEDSGKLKRSAFIETFESATGPGAIIGYARFGQPHYAAFVHEMIHIPHARGKSAKFLEIAVNEKTGIFKRRLFRYITENSGFK